MSTGGERGKMVREEGREEEGRGGEGRRGRAGRGRREGKGGPSVLQAWIWSGWAAGPQATGSSGRSTVSQAADQGARTRRRVSGEKPPWPAAWTGQCGSLFEAGQEAWQCPVSRFPGLQTSMKALAATLLALLLCGPPGRGGPGAGRRSGHRTVGRGEAGRGPLGQPVSARPQAPFPGRAGPGAGPGGGRRGPRAGGLR